MLDFTKFKVAAAKQFERMSQHTLFRADVSGDELWETYLASFPPGTNPIYRERTEHDCSCCKQFIRAVGNVAAVIDGRVTTIWDLVVNDSAYQRVAKEMAKLVKSKPLVDRFLHYERTAGTDKNFEQLVDGTQTWNHFFVNIPGAYVRPGHAIATELNDHRTAKEVLARGLQEITLDAVDTVLELVAQNALYRGEEQKFVLTEFRKLKVEWADLDPEIDNGTFAWTKAVQAPASVARIRNSALGTLLLDLSNGVDLDKAVKAFETIVAPANYKRPTALITQAMIDKAKAKIEELGLTSALERRYAKADDLTINNVLFADRSVKEHWLTGGAFGDITPTKVQSMKALTAVDEVPIEKFLADILPKAESVEVMFENKHAGNLVSLIAPVDPTAGRLFKWDNNFSWSYNGDMADSIKEKVKAAGGNVTGDLCCRLSWFNHDDLDLHLFSPDGHIYYINRTVGGGHLDVDMNAGMGRTREPVENIYYESRRSMKEGRYRLEVNQFNRRESKDVGFEVEIDYLGTVHRFAYPKMVSGSIQVATFDYTHKGGFKLIESLPETEATRTLWGLPTQQFQKVEMVLLSPNHWDDKAVGNKHYFFVLDKCKNDGTARGFFNEFLDSRLDPHRKVFEVVGSKAAVKPSDEQLSGLGFSSTQRNTLLCRVKGTFSRTVKVVF